MIILPSKAFAYLITIAQTNLGFPDLAGWWSADPVHGGESAHMALQFVEKDGKPEALLSAPALGVYDYSLGAVTISGNAIATSGLSFALTWDPASRTLAGNLPADLVPTYQVPVECRRSAPLEKTPARDWNATRPKVVWSVETGAPVWAGLERVKTRKGLVYAADLNGKVSAFRLQP